jgi:hypothetical protein
VIDGDAKVSFIAPVWSKDTIAHKGRKASDSALDVDFSDVY